MNSTYKVNLSERAQDSIREIVYYVSRELLARDAALNLAEVLRDAVLSLGDLPKRIRLLPDEPWQSMGIRRLQTKNYYIYFIVDDNKLEVNILDIIYNKREQERILREISKGSQLYD